VGSKTNHAILDEIKKCLSKDQKLLGTIFNLMDSGVLNAQELAVKSNAANRGVVYNNINILKSITDGSMPTSSSVSRYTIRAIERLTRENEISNELGLYFKTLKERLRENANSLNALKFDQEVLDSESEKLSAKSEIFTNAIYVYSFPTYIQSGTLEDPEVMWLKIGSTRNSVWRRIVEQNRQTSMPEDPKLLRIYHKKDLDVIEVEHKFHETLDKVGHERSANSTTKAGKEWFATTLEALDAIAKLMDLEIESEINF
jgi:hypothetical protein